MYKYNIWYIKYNIKYHVRISIIKRNWVLSVQGSMKQLRREIDRRLDYVNYVTHEPQVNQLDFWNIGQQIWSPAFFV